MEVDEQFCLGGSAIAAARRRLCAHRKRGQEHRDENTDGRDRSGRRCARGCSSARFGPGDTVCGGSAELEVARRKRLWWHAEDYVTEA